MILELENIRKSFGKNSVLKGINLQLEAGKFYALLGKNGSGKSTLMKLLMRLVLPSGGNGNILGFKLNSDDEKMNLEIAYISEDISYGGDMKLSRFFRDYHLHYPKWDRVLFNEFLSVQNLDSEKKFNELSRGQKMQVALAAGLATHPKLLLLDEITSVLDAGARSYFLRYLKEFKNNGGTIIMATNIVSEVQHYAEHLILLEKGEIKINLPILEISSSFSKIRKSFSANIPILNSQECAEIGSNADNTISYIVPTSSIDRYKTEGILPDKRMITIEELFIYFTNGKRS